MGFNVGDTVHHSWVPEWKGTVVRVDPNWPDGHSRVYWKGWDPLDPEHTDWTWDHSLVLVRRAEGPW